MSHAKFWWNTNLENLKNDLISIFCGIAISSTCFALTTSHSIFHRPPPVWFTVRLRLPVMVASKFCSKLSPFARLWLNTGESCPSINMLLCSLIYVLHSIIISFQKMLKNVNIWWSFTLLKKYLFLIFYNF